jgi:CDP-diacylglycerol---glycerol-3-phosphate 3-phosphatidyltransferase
VTLPNALTVARAAAAIPVIWLIALGDDPAALVVFVLAAATDLVDGPLARRRNAVTQLGTFLDPLADKVLIVGTLAALVLRGAAPALLVAIVVARELVAIEVRLRSPASIGAAREGKLKTVLQAVAGAGLLANLVWPSAGLAAVSAAVLAAATLLTVLSGVMLVRRAA